MGDSKLKRCVRREYPPTDGEDCREKEKTCLWGQQRCDGDIEPTSRCNCANDIWSCQAFHCPSVEDEFCPATPDSSLVCRNDLFCGYEEKVCERCLEFSVKLPTTQCSCTAGQFLTCETFDACADESLTCADLASLQGATDWFPTPSITERKIDATKSHDELNNNPAACPVSEPEYVHNGTVTEFVAGTCAAGETYECGYGWSCCCPDQSQCSSDLKCSCENEKLVCEPKHCDQFLCIGAPKLLNSPFPEDPSEQNILCPAHSEASKVVASGLKGECSTEDDFYHCVYGFECCCPGRYCSSEMQCTCSVGVFSCDQRTCPLCEAGAPDVVCPVEAPVDLPNQRTFCPNPPGETCGFGKLECCGTETAYAQTYCTCENSLWDCFDAGFLCKTEDACQEDPVP